MIGLVQLLLLPLLSHTDFQVPTVLDPDSGEEKA